MFFWLSIIVFIFNQAMQTYKIYSIFSASYLDDLLFFPIALSLIKFIQEIITKDKKYVVPFSHLFIGLVIISVLFEFLLPLIGKQFTSDLIDIIFYIIGASIFYLTQTIEIKIKPDVILNLWRAKFW
jgi:hypothetical protein